MQAEKENTAKTAKHRLFMVLAKDRSQHGNRQLYYKGKGRIRFDPPVSILPDETLLFETEFIDGNRHWEAVVIKATGIAK